MPKTAELLRRALAIKGPSAWARELNIAPSAITNARRNGRLSPALAGNIAIDMGEDPARWMLAAYMESEKETQLIERLKSRVPGWKATAAL